MRSRAARTASAEPATLSRLLSKRAYRRAPLSSMIRCAVTPSAGAADGRNRQGEGRRGKAGQGRRTEEGAGQGRVGQGRWAEEWAGQGRRTLCQALTTQCRDGPPHRRQRPFGAQRTPPDDASQLHRAELCIMDTRHPSVSTPSSRRRHSAPAIAVPRTTIVSAGRAAPALRPASPPAFHAHVSVASFLVASACNGGRPRHLVQARLAQHLLASPMRQSSR